MLKKRETDIIIVGGGLAGMTQALLLGKAGFKVICLDQGRITNQIKTDERTTAISYGSSQILHQAGIWKDIEPHGCPIKDIKILDGNSPVLLDFDVNDVNQPAMGWILDNAVLREVMAKAIKKKKNKNITHIEKAIVSDFVITQDQAKVILDNGKTHTAKLIIGADGRGSKTRDFMKVETKSWSYNQTAIIAMVNHENPHNHIAIEHFRSEGPFAVLPMKDDKNGNHRSAVVWTLHDGDTEPFMDNDNLFLAAMRERFPDFYGNIQTAGKRQAYPLTLIHAYHYVTPRMALIADAAHGIHPIAGQGLNLGLRDTEALTRILQENKENDIGDLLVLKQYESERRIDNTAMVAATDILNKLFSNNLKTARMVRSTGLKIIEKIPFAKKFFMTTAMGLKKRA
jgi:2-octaprenyl-6-methoxyphenol hydroxylase